MFGTGPENAAPRKPVVAKPGLRQIKPNQGSNYLESFENLTMRISQTNDVHSGSLHYSMGHRFE